MPEITSTLVRTGAAVVAPSIEKKAWGPKRTVFYAPDKCLVEHASPRKGGFSSRHCHEENFNEFYLLSGELRVTFYTPQGEETCSIVLMPGQRLTVPPKLWHRFECLEDCELIETYWKTGLAVGDIVRADEGGLLT